MPADQQDRAGAGRPDPARAQPVEAADERDADLRADRAASELLELPVLALLGPERLDYRDSGERLLHVRMQLALDLAALPAGLADRLAQRERRERHDRRDGERDEG